MSPSATYLFLKGALCLLPGTPDTRAISPSYCMLVEDNSIFSDPEVPSAY